MKRLALLGALALTACSHGAAAAPYGPCTLTTDGQAIGPCSILDDSAYDVIWDPQTHTWSIEPLYHGPTGQTTGRTVGGRGIR